LYEKLLLAVEETNTFGIEWNIEQLPKVWM
jgi:hypothetical protein